MTAKTKTKATASVPVTPPGAVSRFLSIREAAELLRVSQVSIRRYLGQKKLRRYKVGARTLLQYEDVIALVREA